jgi:hypothetical protein
MIKLLLTRVFPIGASVAIFGSALSPVAPTLNLFQAAASALAGETEVQADVSGLQPSGPQADPLLPKKKLQPKGEKRKKLEALADQLGQSDEDTFGWKAGDRGTKPISPKK